MTVSLLHQIVPLNGVLIADMLTLAGEARKRRRRWGDRDREGRRKRGKISCREGNLKTAAGVGVWRQTPFYFQRALHNVPATCRVECTSPCCTELFKMLIHRRHHSISSLIRLLYILTAEGMMLWSASATGRGPETPESSCDVEAAGGLYIMLTNGDTAPA